MKTCGQCGSQDILLEDNILVCKKCGNIIELGRIVEDRAQEHNQYVNQRIVVGVRAWRYQKDNINKIKNAYKLSNSMTYEIKDLFAKAISNKEFNFQRHKSKTLLLCICSYYMLKKYGVLVRLSQLCNLLDVSPRTFTSKYLTFRKIIEGTNDLSPQDTTESYSLTETIKKFFIDKFGYDSRFEGHVSKMTHIYNTAYDSSGCDAIIYGCGFIAWKHSVRDGSRTLLPTTPRGTPFGGHPTYEELKRFCDMHSHKYTYPVTLRVVKRMYEIMFRLGQKVPWLARNPAFDKVPEAVDTFLDDILQYSSEASAATLKGLITEPVQGKDGPKFLKKDNKHKPRFSTTAGGSDLAMDQPKCPPDSQPIGEVDIPDHEMHMYLKH